MTRNQGSAPAIIIAPHYYWLQEEFRRIRAKLEAEMARPTIPMGLEIVEGKAALNIWEHGLRRTTRRLPSLLRSFSATILARSQRPSHRQTQRVVIGLEQEVNRLLALHRQLWQQPFSQNFRQGQELLSRCIEKIAADLHDLFTFFIATVEAYAGKVEVGPGSHVWDREIHCRVEMTAYKSWSDAILPPSLLCNGLLALPRLVHGLLAGVDNRGDILPDLMV